MKTIVLLIVMLAFSTIANSQSLKQISGKVTDEQNQALPGVNVSVENSKRGTCTDINGLYKIDVLATDKVLVFSFVGMEPKRVAINNRKNIDVVMKKIITDIQEVVAIGYGTQKKVDLTGALSAVMSPMKSYRSKGANVFYMADAEYNTESYAATKENGFKSTIANPLSTFSIDVDNASYSNVRRFINDGRLPDAGAVRVEEMINYFKYDYPEPTGKHPFSVSSELSVCPWNKDHQLLHIGLQGEKIDVSELPPSNLVFLLDVSGSMGQHNKLPLVKKAFRLLVNELRPEDKVSIVVYAGAAGLVLEPTPGNQKSKILKAIEKLNAGGSTAGGQGIKLAYKTAAENLIQGGNNRIILATDGDFNVGVSSNSAMQDLVEKERDKGIFITVLGFGMGNYKDDKMEIIADKGNGNYAYIDNFQEARKVFISEFGGTLFTIAKDVKFQLEFNPQHVKSYRLVGYENRLLNDEDFNDDTKDAGEMGAGHTVTALYEIIPATSDENTASVDPLKYQKQKQINKAYSDEMVTIKLRYKDPESSKSKLFQEIVDSKPMNIEMTSDNFRFSAAVAEFGMLLKSSAYKGSANVGDIIKLAQSSKGEDEEGYRAEFIQLVKTVKDLNLFAMEK